MKLSSKLAALVLTLPALASATTIYTYVGSPFTIYSGAFTSTVETNITASITLAAPLGPNYTEATQIIPLAFSISDGNITLTNSSPNLDAVSTFYFGTDSSGNIDAWDMDVVQGVAGAWLQLLTEQSGDDTTSCGGGPVGICSSIIGQARVGYLSNQPGWTQTNLTPEPSTFAMFAAALLGIGFLRAFRARRAFGA